MVMIDDANQWKLDRLIKAGLITSFVYGDSKIDGIYWSVMVWHDGKEIFDKAFAAESFEHGLDIAIKECEERGLLTCVKRLHG